MNTFCQLLFLTDCIKNDWILWESTEEAKILYNYVKLGKKFVTFCLLYIFGATTAISITALIPSYLDVVQPLNETRPRAYVFPVKFFFDDSKISFIYTFMYGLIAAIYHMTINVSTEAMYSTTTMHACGLFAIVSYRLEKFFRYTECTLANKDTYEIFYKELSYTVKYHNYAIRYANKLQEFYSSFLFFSIGGNIMMISIDLFQAFNAIGQSVYILKYIFYTVTFIYKVYLLGIPAQYLLNQSGQIAIDIYASTWYNVPGRFRNMIPLVIMQSCRPCVITVGPITTMNFETVSNILKLSLSYFTMLTSVTSK